MDLLEINIVITAMLAGMIWTVQLVQYPLMARIGPAGFRHYHDGHMNRMTWIVGPLMPAEVVAAAALVFEGEVDPAVAWSAAGLVGLAWLATGLLAVPIHHRLTSGFDETLVRRLVGTNWIRTIAWTARLALLLLARSGLSW